MEYGNFNKGVPQKKVLDRAIRCNLPDKKMGKDFHCKHGSLNSYKK